MKRVLLVNASPHSDASHVWRFAMEWMEKLRQTRTPPELTIRDLAAAPLPPLQADYAHALTARTPFDAPVFNKSEALIRELEDSELLLITTPMHNFTVPSALKLWIDYVLRIGRTFEATAQGKSGLLRDRPVYVIVGSGGFHQGEKAGQPDFLTAYLRHALGTLGLVKVHFVYLQGLVCGEEVIRAQLEQARRQISSFSLRDPVAFP